MYLGKEEGQRAINHLLTQYLCLTAGATYADVAREIGVHERTLYKWLSGHTRISSGVVKLLELMVAQKSV